MDVRLRLGLATLLALAVSAFVAAPALADTQPDPQLSNIPYLAWRGEEVALVKCEQAIGGINVGNVDVLLVDSSGDPHLAAPQVEPGSVTIFTSSTGVPCVGVVVVSQKAGLAQFKLVVQSVGGLPIL
ncbi:MAG: hypothetical protein M3322_08555 [Actinomycetota bacterium]|nr:hypothetical protein [Actinomycetota bacterium]